MKNFIRIIFALLMLVIATNNCTFLPDAVDKMVDPLKTGPFGYLEVSGSTEPQTKLTMEVNDGGTGTKSALYWSANDSIGIFLTNGTNTYHAKYSTTSGSVTSAGFNLVTIKNVTGGKLVSTTTENPALPVGTYTIYAYYPYNDTTLSPSSVGYYLSYIQFQHGKDNADHIGTYGFAYADPIPNVTIENNSNTHIELSFKMRTCILELYTPPTTTEYEFINDPGVVHSFENQAITSYLFYDEDATDIAICQIQGAVNLTSTNTDGLPALVNPKGRSQVAVTNSISGDSGESNFGTNSRAYIQFLPDQIIPTHKYGIGMRLPISSNIYNMKAGMIPPTGGFKAGKKYRVTFSNPITLTKVFEDLTDGQKRLANTYFVPSPSIEVTHQAYGFVATIEGNDIYTPTGTTIDSYTAATEYKAADYIVAHPVIVFEEGYTNTGTYTNNVLDGNVKVAGNYFYFKVNSDIQTANVVIGALNFSTSTTANNVNNKPMWTWHLWVSDKLPDTISDSAEENNLLNSIQDPSTNIYSTTMGGFMDRNLGALQASSTNNDLVRGLLYQWGRLVPLRSKTANNRESGGTNTLTSATNNAAGKGRYSYYHPSTTRYSKAATFTFEGSTHYNGILTYNASSDYSASYQTSAGAVRDVYFYIVQTASHKWYGIHKNNEDYTWADETKTRFDPCPWGWKVPSAQQLVDFFPTNDTQVEKVNTSDVYYSAVNNGTSLPAGGLIEIDNANVSSYVIQNETTEGLYWSSSFTPESGTVNLANALGFYFLYDTDNNTFTLNHQSHFKRKAASIRCVRFSEPTNSTVIR